MKGQGHDKKYQEKIYFCVKNKQNQVNVFIKGKDSRDQDNSSN